jgi:aminoglycoside phosphotransferase
VPPTVAHVETLGLVVQGHVNGVPLDEVLRTGTGCRGEARAALTHAALAVAALHETLGVTVRQRPVERELRRFAERARRASYVDPELGTSSGRLAQRLEHTLRSLPPALVGTTHGDCKPGQFLVTRDGVSMLDLDHLGVSDQAADIGTFLATLRQQKLRRSMTSTKLSRSDRTADHATWFLEAYLSVRGDRMDRNRIRWQEAVALQRKALRAFSRAPRSPLARALVAEGNHCLDLLEEAR